MCLPDFERFEQVDESNPITGYRSWLLEIHNEKAVLKSLNREYYFNSIIEGPHEVLDSNSGIYSYHYNNNNDNYYYYYNYHYYNNNYHYYNIAGIIYQYGKVAVHKDGYRSEYAKIVTLFTIKEADAIGNEKFLNWIKQFNERVKNLAKKYNANTIHWQDFVKNQK